MSFLSGRGYAPCLFSTVFSTLPGGTEYPVKASPLTEYDPARIVFEYIRNTTLDLVLGQHSEAVKGAHVSWGRERETEGLRDDGKQTGFENKPEQSLWL